jgi:hypothetical protein
MRADMCEGNGVGVRRGGVGVEWVEISAPVAHVHFEVWAYGNGCDVRYGRVLDGWGGERWNKRRQCFETVHFNEIGKRLGRLRLGAHLVEGNWVLPRDGYAVVITEHGEIVVQSVALDAKFGGQVGIGGIKVVGCHTTSREGL